MSAVIAERSKVVYWHGELPPFDAAPLGEHHIEATSDRVPSTTAHRDELWEECRVELARHVEQRLKQEVVRLGGRFARVLDESVEVKRDGAAGQAWLRGHYRYMLFR